MYGEKAIDLIREIKRNSSIMKIPTSSNPNGQNVFALSFYNEATVSSIVEEICSLYQEIYRSLEVETPENLQSAYVASRLVVYHNAIQRNKRCLLAYLMERMKRLERIRWEYASVLPNHLKQKILCASEVSHFKKYSANLNSYMKSVKIDLTADLNPPKSLYIEVRCTVDFGEIQTENGIVNLTKNSQHFLRRSDVESLVKQGILQHVS